MTTLLGVSTPFGDLILLLREDGCSTSGASSALDSAATCKQTQLHNYNKSCICTKAYLDPFVFSQCVCVKITSFFNINVWTLGYS